MCLVTVSAYDGDYFEELACHASGTACSCHDAGERPGTYLVEVRSQDDVVASQEVTVESDGCHVMTESVSFTLP